MGGVFVCMAMNRFPIVLAAPLFCVPFLAYVHAEPLVSFHHEWIAAACGLLFLLAQMMTHRTGTTEIPVATVLPLLVIALLFTQLANDMIVYPSQGRVAIICMVLAASVMIATHSLMRRFGIDKLANVIAWSLLAGGGLQGVAAVFQYWSIHTFLDPFIAARASLVAFGNLAQANHFADYQSMSLAALFFLVANKRLSSAAALLMGGWLLFSLTLSGSRGSWLYLIAFLGLAYALHRKAPSERSRQLILFALLSLVTYLAIQVFLGLLETHPTTAGNRLITNPGGALTSRLSMWSSALNMFAQAPLLGVGYQNYSWQYFLNHSGPSISPTNAHNIALHMLAEFGVGGGVFILLIGYWTYKAAHSLVTVEQWLVLTLIAILLIHSMLEFPLHYLHFMLPGAALLVLTNEKSQSVAVSDKLMMPLTLLLFAVGAAILVTTLNSHSLLTRAYADFSTGGMLLDRAQRERLIAVQQSTLFEPEAENLLNSLRITHGNLDLLPSLLAVSSKQVRQKTGASRVFRHILLLSLNNNMTEANRLLTRTAQAYPEQLEDFKKKLAVLRVEFPAHSGLQALNERLPTLRAVRSGKESL